MTVKSMTASCNSLNEAGFGTCYAKLGFCQAQGPIQKAAQPSSLLRTQPAQSKAHHVHRARASCKGSTTCTRRWLSGLLTKVWPASVRLSCSSMPSTDPQYPLPLTVDCGVTRSQSPPAHDQKFIQRQPRTMCMAPAHA